MPNEIQWPKAYGGEPSHSVVDEMRKRYAPSGWTEQWKRDSNTNIWENCHAHFDKKEFYTPNPYLSLAHLFQWTHEHGHVELKHGSKGWNHYHIEEFETERWSMDTFRRHGLRVPRRCVAEAKLYVRWCIAKDRRQGIEIRRDIACWADYRWRTG